MTHFDKYDLYLTDDELMVDLPNDDFIVRPPEEKVMDAMYNAFIADWGADLALPLRN